MTSLVELKCEPCQAGASGVQETEEAEFLQQIPDWRVIERDGERRLQRVYKFPDFAEAIRFTDQVAGLAEEAGHHPALLTEWGRVTVTWWTHKIRGLHRNDFVMAAKTDEAYSSRSR